MFGMLCWQSDIFDRSIQAKSLHFTGRAKKKFSADNSAQGIGAEP
jgi:hypothetical protein